MTGMILDTLQNAALYHAVHPRFAAAFEYLERTDLSTLTPGRNEIDGENLFIMSIATEGYGHGAGPVEVHRAYIDIHLTLEGTDEIGWIALADCSQTQMEFNTEDDAALYGDTPEFYSVLKPGTFGIYFPQDAHVPLAGTGEVRKVVVKILI